MEIIVNNRTEFLKLIKSMFIPYLINNDMTVFIDVFKQNGLFNDWTCFFYENVVVTLKENKKNELYE